MQIQKSFGVIDICDICPIISFNCIPNVSLQRAILIKLKRNCFKNGLIQYFAARRK